LVILIGSALVSIRTTIYLSIGNLLWILLLPLIIPGVLYGNLVIPALFNGILSALVLVLTQSRNLTERERLSEMANINATLQASNDVLNARTRDLDARTRELDLAAEVGRAISQVRSLALTLKEAAEIIRSRFDLYYVQVYLTDLSQTSLVLQSGTGTVGAELMARGHQLPLNMASINGRAAIEKHTVVISDTSTTATFRPNPLLPDTRSEMAVPLMIGENVLGVLDLQSQKTGALNDEMLSAFEALAGQFAIAIQNARLLQEIQQSRAEVESQARRLTRAGWQEYLDALHKPEKLGFVYEQNQVALLEEIPESVHEANALAVPIAITGEQIGTLAVSVEEGKQTANNVELVNIVARQVAQQIENLRLLDSAERYRRDAEEAARHLTREGWQNYAESKSSEELGFLYDLKEVKPYAQHAEILAEQPNMILPLKVRDEKVGKLAILGVDETDTEANELATAVAERLSAHIEGLRLSKQTEQALATTQEFAQREQSLRQITSAVRGSTDPATILRTAVRELGTVLGRKIVVRMENTREAQASQTDSGANNGEKTNSPAGLLNAVGGDE
ncbi:MAG TPA: GAF domain-containing protein, partial [Anaerolineales bacterium]